MCITVRSIYLTIFLLTGLLLAGEKDAAAPQWQYNLEQAQAQARKENKAVVLYFSGSDWCRPCIQLKKAVFHAPEFVKFAGEKLVMVLLDFPAKKKNKLTPEQTAYNESLAERFNDKGAFPLVVLLEADGTVLASFSGYKDESPADYILKLQESLATHD